MCVDSRNQVSLARINRFTDHVSLLKTNLSPQIMNPIVRGVQDVGSLSASQADCVIDGITIPVPRRGAMKAIWNGLRDIKTG
jgi:hypothetical protein